MTVKQGFWIGMAMGFCFALGCGAAITVIPPARAQSTQRWEYLTIDHGWDGGRWANEAGAEGWEYIGADPWSSHALIFKRPLP